VAPVNGAGRKIAELPGPRALPLFGNLLQLDAQRLHLVLEDWARSFGSLYAFRAGPKRTVAVSDPVLLEQILRARPDQYRRIGRIESVLAELEIPGVFSAEGAAWRPQRRLMTMSLSTRRSTDFYPRLQLVLERLFRRWRAASGHGTTLDVVAEFKRLTVDLTMLLAFGHDANTIEHDGDELQKQLRQILPILNRRITAPFPYWRFFRSPVDRRIDRAVFELRERLSRLIAEARQRLDAEPTRADKRSDLLSAMLLARDEAGQPFSDELILGNALQVLVAGQDTTAATLAWAVHLLCEQPDVVAWLREEVDAVVGSASVVESAEEAARLVRVDAVLQEALRLRSSSPVIFLESVTDVVLDGVSVPRGTWVLALTRVAALRDEHFARAQEFLPERWLDAAPVAESGSRGHIPFGSGSRICPGRALALTEMRVALAMLYGNFDVQRVGPPEQVGERFAFIVEPTRLRVKLQPRVR